MSVHGVVVYHVIWFDYVCIKIGSHLYFTKKEIPSVFSMSILNSYLPSLIIRYIFSNPEIKSGRGKRSAHKTIEEEGTALCLISAYLQTLCISVGVTILNHMICQFVKQYILYLSVICFYLSHMVNNLYNFLNIGYYQARSCPPCHQTRVCIRTSSDRSFQLRPLVFGKPGDERIH